MTEREIIVLEPASFSCGSQHPVLHTNTNKYTYTDLAARPVIIYLSSNAALAQIQSLHCRRSTQTIHNDTQYCL